MTLQHSIHSFPHFLESKIYSSSNVTHSYFFLCCLAWLRDLLALFFFPLPTSSQPLKLFPENAGIRRKRKKTVLVCALQPLTLHNIHWHTGVACILFSMQTRCEVMYGSMFFFLFLFSKGRQIYAKNVVLWPSSLSDVKINFRLIPHFPPSACSGWDDTVWFSIIVMLLCCRQSSVERSETKSGNAVSAVI